MPRDSHIMKPRKLAKAPRNGWLRAGVIAFCMATGFAWAVRVPLATIPTSSLSAAPSVSSTGTSATAIEPAHLRPVFTAPTVTVDPGASVTVPAVVVPAAAASKPAPAPAAETNAPRPSSAAPVVAESAPSISAPNVPLAPATNAPAAGASTNQNISLVFDDVPLTDAVKLFARISGANIIASSSNLQGLVTANLQDVPWRPAFETILARQGLQLIESTPGSTIFSIVDARRADDDSRTSEAIILNRAKVDEVTKLLQNVLGKSGSVTPFPSGNAVIVNASPLRIAEMRKIIEGLDAPRTLNGLESSSETISLQYAKVDDVIKLVQGSLGESGSVQPFPYGNALVVNATSARITNVRTLIATLDRPRPQVYIDAKFVELNDGDSKNIGINWQTLGAWQIQGQVSLNTQNTKTTGNTTGTGSGTANATGQGNAPGPATTTASGSSTTRYYDMNGNPMPLVTGYQTVNGVSVPIITPTTTTYDNRNVAESSLRSITAVLSPGDFSVVLSMLEGNTGAKLISNPRIIVASDQHSIIKMAEDEPNIEITRSRATVQGQEDLITSSLDKKEPYFTYGITLTVTPQVNGTSNITVVIKPEISSKLDVKTAPDGNTFPIVQKKSIETIFTLGNGRTAAIGGLIQTTVNDVQTKIPVLGDIPILGPRLFSYKSHVRQQSEMVIFVTVGIVDPQSADQFSGMPSASELVRKDNAENKAPTATTSTSGR